MILLFERQREPLSSVSEITFETYLADARQGFSLPLEEAAA